MNTLNEEKLKELESLLNKTLPKPWHVTISDTGGKWTGFPSIVAPEEVDKTIVHYGGFKQEHWQELSMKDAEIHANLMTSAVNSLPELISMARRTLEVEERLRKAVEASRKANESLSWLISQRFLDPETDNQRFYEALVALRYAKEVIEDRPKAIRPPAQCAPPVGTDVQPDRDLNKSVININFSSSFLQGNAELVDGRWWFRYDTEDSTTQANEDVLRDLIAPELAEHGLELEDPCIEHDCISGFLKLT